MAANADYLVTGDRRHLLPFGERRGTLIANAPRFLSVLAQVRQAIDEPLPPTTDICSLTTTRRMFGDTE